MTAPLRSCTYICSPSTVTEKMPSFLPSIGMKAFQANFKVTRLSCSVVGTVGRLVTRDGIWADKVASIIKNAAVSAANLFIAGYPRSGKIGKDLMSVTRKAGG